MTAMIRMLTFEPVVLTVEEFEGLEREVAARLITDDASTGDRILGRLLMEHHGRCVLAKEQNTPAETEEEPA